MNEEDASWGIGFVIGFFLGVIGILIAVAIGKKKTMKGAGAGALVSFVLAFIITCSSGLRQYDNYHYAIWLLL